MNEELKEHLELGGATLKDTSKQDAMTEFRLVLERIEQLPFDAMVTHVTIYDFLTMMKLIHRILKAME